LTYPYSTLFYTFQSAHAILTLAFQDFEKLFVKLQSSNRFLLHAISQYWDNYGLMQNVSGCNL